MKNAVRFSLVLGLITIAAALGVSGVYQLTRGRIEEKQRKSFAADLEAIFPDADEFVRVDAEGSIEDLAAGVGVGAARVGGEVAGYVAVGEKQGYASKIRVLIGCDDGLAIKGIRIMSQAETPGLGERTKEVKTDRTIWQAAGESVGLSEVGEPGAEPVPWFQAQFSGKTLELLVVVKDESEGGIVAITGATITSGAVTDAVREAVEKVRAHLRGTGVEPAGAEADSDGGE